jgi:hypothetical protein
MAKFFTPIELESLIILLQPLWLVLIMRVTTFLVIVEGTNMSEASVARHTTLPLPEMEDLQPTVKPCCASVRLGRHVRHLQMQIWPNLITIVGDAD